MEVQIIREADQMPVGFTVLGGLTKLLSIRTQIQRGSTEDWAHYDRVHTTASKATEAGQETAFPVCCQSLEVGGAHAITTEIVRALDLKPIHTNTH